MRGICYFLFFNAYYLPKRYYKTVFKAMQILRLQTKDITYYDLKNLIVSGRFEPLLSKTDCEDIIITEGRFDVRY